MSDLSSKLGFRAAVALIARWEGFEEEAYWDVKQWSIGFGTKSKKGERITRRLARVRMERVVSRIYNRIESICLACSSNQVASLTSFAYNVGRGNLQRSTLWRLALQGRHREAEEQFNRWVFADGSKLNGLKRRRNSERRLYQSYQF